MRRCRHLPAAKIKFRHASYSPLESQKLSRGTRNGSEYCVGEGPRVVLYLSDISSKKLVAILHYIHAVPYVRTIALNSITSASVPFLKIVTPLMTGGLLGKVVRPHKIALCGWVHLSLRYFVVG
jgi:hypothetical protein